jgi:hypothetical protein
MDINEVSKSISHQVIIFYTIILFFKKKTQKIWFQLNANTV